MRIVTWNVNSLKARAELVAEYLDEAQPDVLCLQELKLDTAAVPRALFEARGYSLAVHGQPQWNGVLIASRAPLTDITLGFDGEEGQSRLVAATVAGVRIVNLYCPQGGSADSDKFGYKLRFYDALIAWLHASLNPAEPLVLLGDLNIAPNADDVWDVAEFENVPTYHPLEHERWARLVEWGLRDVVVDRLPADPKQRYTFWDYRDMCFRFNKGMRIDHVLATAAVVPRVKEAAVGRDWRKKRGELKPSDHAPVMVELA